MARQSQGAACKDDISPPDSPQWKQRIALLTSTNVANKNLNIELMNERAAMLADVADQVFDEAGSRRSASRFETVMIGRINLGPSKRDSATLKHKK